MMTFLALGQRKTTAMTTRISSTSSAIPLYFPTVHQYDGVCLRRPPGTLARTIGFSYTVGILSAYARELSTENKRFSVTIFKAYFCTPSLSRPRLSAPCLFLRTNSPSCSCCSSSALN